MTQNALQYMVVCVTCTENKQNFRKPKFVYCTENKCVHPKYIGLSPSVGTLVPKYGGILMECNAWIIIFNQKIRKQDWSFSRSTDYTDINKLVRADLNSTVRTKSQKMQNAYKF